MAVSDVAVLREELAETQAKWKLNTDSLHNPGFNARDLTDGEQNVLHELKTRLGWKTQIKRSGTGLRVTFYKEEGQLE